MKDVVAENDNANYTIDIICPLYNGENYIVNLHESLKKQDIYNKINGIRYIVTKGKDNTEKIIEDIKDEKVIYKIIKPEEFSHSLTREKEANESDADILVFITQDVKIMREDWLRNLVSPIVNNEVDATYSRQICNDKSSIEYYTRQKNYPEKSFVKTKEDIKKLGINAYFYSDVASAIRRKIFIKLNGYDGKKLPTNEDMYIAYKLINNNYKIKYCADSEVVHSHNFNLKETFKRYKLYGEFLDMEPQVNVKSTDAGGGLAKFIIKNAIKDENWKIVFKFLPNMISRFMGMKAGKSKMSQKKSISVMLISFIILILNIFIYYNISNTLASVVLGILSIFMFIFYKKFFNYYTNMPGIFSFIWLFTIGMSTLRLHPKQIVWDLKTWICLIGAYIFFILGYFLCYYKNINRKTTKIKKEKVIEKKNFSFFYFIIACIPIIAFIIEVILNKGSIPLFSKEMSAYQKFGKGIIHYFTVSSCLVLPISYFFIHFFKTSKKEKIVIAIISAVNILIPVFIVSRQLIIVSIVLLSFGICLLNKKAEKIIIVSALLFVFVGWTIVGLFRNQNKEYLKKALEMGESNIPVSTMQIYMYVSMNYDNFNHNIKEYENYKYGINSIYPVFGLLRIKKYMPQELFKTDCSRIIDVYTTYPIVNTPYTDGGVLAVLIYMLIIGLLCAYVERVNKQRPFYYMFTNIIKVCLTFSFFSSWFSTPVWWFYVIMIFVMTKIILKNGKVMEEGAEKYDENKNPSINVDV